MCQFNVTRNTLTEHFKNFNEVLKSPKNMLFKSQDNLKKLRYFIAQFYLFNDTEIWLISAAYILVSYMKVFMTKISGT